MQSNGEDCSGGMLRAELPGRHRACLRCERVCQTGGKVDACHRCGWQGNPFRQGTNIGRVEAASVVNNRIKTLKGLKQP